MKILAKTLKNLDFIRAKYCKKFSMEYINKNKEVEFLNNIYYLFTLNRSIYYVIQQSIT